MKELADALPQIIIYIVMGFAFLKPYHFVALKQNADNIEHALITSLVVGFIYCKIINMIPFSISYEIDIIGMFVLAIVSGYILGMFLNSKHFLNILDFLKIRDTLNKYYWDDLMDKNYPMKVTVYYDNKIYTGMLHNYENYSNSPHLILASYTVKDANNNSILEDNSKNATRVCIIDSSQADIVEVIYDKNSFMCDDLKDLCESNPINKISTNQENSN